MSLRDQFAREAMNGILSNSEYTVALQERAIGKTKVSFDEIHKSYCSEIASDAYAIADAMLKEREKKEGE